MTAALARDKSVFGGWWLSVNRLMLGALALLCAFGVLLVSAASPAVAERIGLPPFYFVQRHLEVLAVAVALMLWTSLFSRKALWRVSTLVLLGGFLLMMLTLVVGVEIKGATRWIRILGFSLQPSEFVKPAFAVAAAWLLARGRLEPAFPGFRLACGLYAVTVVLLLLQPDFGMTFVFSFIFAVQIFLAGAPLVAVGGLAALGALGIAGAYAAFPHVASRIDRFLDPGSGDNYQVGKSLAAFGNGGLFGTGPAHGQVKLTLPDAHADFIFAVAGEELGFLITVLLVCLFVFILLRGMSRAAKAEDLFTALAAGGLLSQFALQSLIHMGSSLQLLPAKGMTLPFISYGGSSLLSLGFGMGALLALTRKSPEARGGGRYG